MTAAVYAIVNIVTECRYVGGSLDLETRWRTHRQDLRRGEHPNWRLQADWRRYGGESFILEVLEPMSDVDRPALEQAERSWIERFASHGIDGLYNVSHARAPRGGKDHQKYLASAPDALCVLPRELIGAEE